ncbi:VirB4 family type IV secretion/conjugal transfer ATPase (plasmid) [Ampullimonas aquatilis]|uniref:VirB4 family type IV secretion/conjugal transfer ATPase n=1 Tax=Ampullimonas aquatilis TaxID=1341549 RepID=UPI003C710680
MKSSTKIKESANNEISMSDFIPYSSHLSENVIKMKKTGYLLASWRLDGITFETADVDEILAKKESLNNFIHAMGGGQISFWTHKVRRIVNERLDGDFHIPFCKDFNERYNDSFKDHRQMATELYLTVIYKPIASKVVSFFKRINKKTIEELNITEQNNLDKLDDIAKQVESSLHAYGIERLGTYPKNNFVYSEMLSFFGFLVNGIWEEIPLQRVSISDYLPSSRLHFGDRNGFIEIWHPKKKAFAGMLDFQDYPSWTEPGMNNGILYGDYEYIETQSFSILGKRDAISALKDQKGHLHATEDTAVQEIRQLDEAIEHVQSGFIEMGEYHYSLAIFGDTLDDVAKNMSSARTILQDKSGFKVSVMDAIPESGWFAQLPGNWWMRPREATITSRNFACLSPFHNFSRGKRHGNPWGEGLALFKTPSGQPYYFNFHTSPEDLDSTDEKLPGNTFICGMTGVGKTVLEMSLLMFATKYQGLRAVHFDKDRGAELCIRALGGKYKAIKRGQPTGFNPFQFETSEKNIQFCEKLVKQLVKKPNGLSAKEEAEVSHAVRTVMSRQISHELRSLSAIYQNLANTVGGDGVKERLKKWTRGQPLGWVFDNPTDTQDLKSASIFGYDYTEFLDDPEVRTPIMAYLLHITDTLIDGKPFIYFMEEFWKPLMDEMFSDFALNHQKTIRKLSGLGVFVTQSPSDVLTHRIGKTMVEQSVTQIYLPNPKADRDDYVNGFKLTESEFRIIKNLGETSRMFLVKQGHKSAIVTFDLKGMNDILTIISGSMDNIAIFDEIVEEVGDDPLKWMPLLHSRVFQRKTNIINRKEISS